MTIIIQGLNSAFLITQGYEAEEVAEEVLAVVTATAGKRSVQTAGQRSVKTAGKA